MENNNGLDHNIPLQRSAADDLRHNRQEALKIYSFEELIKAEPQIIGRISKIANGGNLFMAHPLMMLTDVGVALSDRARKELLEREPSLANLSEHSYKVLRDSPYRQPVKIRLKGLFRR